MGRRLTRTGMLSMMDDPAMFGLAQYLSGSRWLRAPEGHGTGGTGDDADDDAGGDDDSDDDTEDDDAEDSTDDKSKKTKAGKHSKDDDEDDEGDDKPRYTQAEYDRMRDRMRGADKAKATAERQLAEFKADGSKLDEATKREIAELKPRVDRLTTDNRDLRLKVAFLSTTVPGVEWVDVEDALRLVDLSDVDIDEDGNVDKRDLKLALKNLAKRKPHLVRKPVKTKTGDEDDDDDDAGTSGSRMNGRRRGTRTEADRAALAKRFPVLNRGR